MTDNTSSSNAIDFFNTFATDSKKETEGTETTMPGCGDTKFIVARAGNASYNRLLSSLYKRNRALLDSKGEAANAKSDEILAEVYAKTILLGWSGTLLIKGVATPYSEQAAKGLLMLKDFRAVVESVAADMNTFKAVQDDEDVKN